MSENRERKTLRFGAGCYWKFIDEKTWRYGWPTSVGHGLVRMGQWAEDKTMGPIVDPKDVEVRNA